MVCYPIAAMILRSLSQILRHAIFWPLLLLSLSACETATPHAAPPPPHAAAVTLYKVSETDLEDVSRYLSTLKSRKAVPLKPQVAGTISQILIRSGDHVEQGAILIKLNPDKQQATVNSLSENTESLVAEKTTAGETLKSLQSTRDSKAAHADFCRQQLARYSALHSQGAVSKEQVDQKDTDLRMALADLAATESQIKAQESTIAKCQKQINQSKASIKEQQEQLQYFTVRSPIAGIIGDVPVHVGEYVTTDTQLTSVNQNEMLEVYISVPTEHSAELKNGLTVRLLDNKDKKIAEGNVFFISPQVNADSQSILVKALVDNKTNQLRSGQLITAEIVWKKGRGLFVPTEAVSMLAGQAFVYIAKDDGHGQLTASQRTVEPQEIREAKYHIVSGLKAGDAVVRTGVQNLVDGMPIMAGSDRVR